MAKIAVITKARLEQSQGAPGKSLLVDIDGHGIDNAEMYQIPGMYNRPQDGITGLILDCNGNNIVIAAYDYKFNESIEVGETLLYSYDTDGAVVGKILIKANGDLNIDSGGATVNILSDGNIELNGNADSAVSYTDLATALNNFKMSIDIAIAGAITGHTHPGVTAGAASTGVGAGSAPATSVDISAAEVSTIKVP